MRVTTLLNPIGCSGVGHSDELSDALLDATLTGRLMDVADKMAADMGGEYAGTMTYDVKGAVVTEWHFHVGKLVVIVTAKQRRSAR